MSFDPRADHHDHRHPVVIELLEHLPFSVGAVGASLLLLAGIESVHGRLTVERIDWLFHGFHPAHLLLSATTTTAMFWAYERRALKAAGVGLIGSVVFCSVSDVLLPYLGGLLLGLEMNVHWCFWDHPLRVLPFVVLGLVAGLVGSAYVRRSTIYSHSGHILVSAMASLLYLVEYGLTDWTSRIGWVLLITTAAVLLPCCFSDIVFPLLFTKSAREAHHRAHQHHPGEPEEGEPGEPT